MTGVALRPAEIDDLDAVVAVFLGCWRATYAGRLPTPLLASMSDDAARSLWSRALTTRDRRVVVGEVDDKVCGVVGFEASVDDGWIHSLYVAPEAQGHGVGSALLRHASDRLLEAGCHRAYLWVFADNTPSISFYTRHGWTPDGTQRVEERFGENEIRLSTSWDRTP
jgi:ribosomal protein S18 acetylase RimI-like enzyme